MPHYRRMFDEPYLGAWDLEGPDGVLREVTVRIERIVMVEVMDSETNQKVRKPALYFTGKQKGMVLNRLNAKMIAKLYGTDSDKWRGKSIVIGTSNVVAFGERYDVLRVRDVRPQPKTSPPPQPAGAAAPAGVDPATDCGCPDGPNDVHLATCPRRVTA